MAKGLDDLIEFLLEEIAVSGHRGVTISDIAHFISSFYDAPEDDPALNVPTENADPSSRVTVDRPLLSKVWSWLGRHPDVSIGDNSRYNKTSLAQVEIQFPNYVNLGPTDEQTAAENDAYSDGSTEASVTLKKRPGSQKARAAEGPRISVNETRIYQAICGHPPDISRVVPLEFELLSHIAAARSTGILQGDLVKASGQDKRSVPKRTDSLQSKGYITKEIVFRHGHRTSRLTLKKFARNNAAVAEPFYKLHSVPKRGSTLRDVVRRTFDVLENHKLISQASLAEELSLGSSGESAVLSKIIRRLEKLKCVKRVRTAVGPSATSDDLRHFIQLLRRADAVDLENFDTDNLSLNQTVEELASISDADVRNGQSIALDAAEEENEESTEAVYKPARWTPDRLMPNILVDAVRFAGPDGLTNMNARKMTTGDFVRRQLESLLLRLSCESLVIQPQHLMHLAIVRTTVRLEGVVQYVHYSWDTFRQKAADHHLDISDIHGARQLMKRLAEKEVGSDDGDDDASLPHIEIDEFGFPLQAPLALQLRHGEATFLDLIRATAPGDVTKRNGEPTIVKQGTKMAMKIRDDVVASSNTTDRTPRRLPHPPRERTRQLAKRRGDSDEEKIVLGRPRKYMRGTEKFWRMQFKHARLNAGANPEHLRKGTAQDPSALAMYAGRPAGFDETLVQALEAGLPIPMLPEHINDDWIRSTRAVLDRSTEGVYMSPRGLRSDSSQRLAQRMIVKTPRLASVDFNDRNIVHPFRFISSSASHSFMFTRYYPNLPTKPPSAPFTSRKSKRQSRPALSENEEKVKPGPRLGVFYENPDLSTARPPQLPNPVAVQPPVDVCMDTTDEENVPSPQGAFATRASSHASINEAVSSDSRIRNGQARRGSQRSTRERDGSPATPVTPSTKRDITETPRLRSVTNQKLTRKAIELLRVDKPHEPRLLSEAREGSSEILAADFELENQVSINRESEVSSVEALPRSINHPPIKERSPDVSYSNRAEIRTTPCTHPNVSSEKQVIVDGDSSAGETEARKGLSSLEKEHIEAPVSPKSLEIMEVAASRSPSMSGRQQESSHLAEVRDNVSQKSSSPPKAGMRKGVSKGNRTRTASIESESSGEESQPKNQQGRKRQRYFEGANVLFRRIILQLIQETSGVVPNDPSTFKRVSLPRWQEAGGEGRPLLKTIKTAIKSLNESRRLKQVMFTFRGKSGTMVKRSVVFLPHIDPLSQAVEDVKQNIINAEPADYIPPEWRGEGYRVPLVNKRAPSRTPEVEERPPRRQHTSSAVSDRTIASTSSRGGRSRTNTIPPSRSPLPETPATGFVTLRVPALGTLPVVHLHNWRQECPVSALRFDTSDANPWKSSAFRPIRRRRRIEEQGSQAAGRSIIWQNFPSSLEDILQLPDLKLDYDAFQADDTDWQRFACEVEGVRAWEENQPDAALSKRSRFAFINHSVPAALYRESVLPPTIEFSNVVHFDEDGNEVELAFPPTESWTAFANALRASPNVTSRIAAVDEEDSQRKPPSPGLGRRRSNRPAKRRISEDDRGFVPLPPPKRRRKGARGPNSAPLRRRDISAINTTNRKLSRSAKWLQTMPEEMIYRIAVAVIVVRTLAGGMQSFINWKIVMTLFPDQKEEVIKARWNTLSTRYSSDIQNLIGDLQSKYLEALQGGEVASVVFDDFEATDWGAIVEWALKSLDHFNLKRIAHLPANRDELLESYAFEFAQLKCFHNIVWNNSTLNFKEEVARSTVFGAYANPTTQPAILGYQNAFELEMATPVLCVAKSWVLAAILTPESVFNPDLAQAKLSTLAPNTTECDALLSHVLKLLQDDKIIQRKLDYQPSEQGLRVRTWEAHRKFFERFEERSMVTPNVLRRAARYKSEVLDREFVQGNSVPFEKGELVPDGEMVAVLNLMASGRVRLRPGANVPRTRYGLDHERIGYRTKNMDKKMLGFSVELTPTTEYWFGDPWSGALGLRQLPIPRGRADEPMGSIPMWVDIHGSVQMALWHTLLVGVMGLVSQMPGVSASQISKTYGSALDEAEVELIMQWCVQSGFAKMDTGSNGYETSEWWWLCVDAAAQGRIW